MTDLNNTGRMFEVSTRLQTAADALQCAAAGDQLEERQSAAMSWAAEFLTSVGEPLVSASGSLSVQATSARPTFIATLMRISSELAREGVSTDDAISSFLKDLLAVLQAGAVQHRTAAAKLGVMLLHQLSQGYLTTVSRSVVHRPATMEK